MFIFINRVLNIHSLTCRDGYHLVDVVNGATAAQVVDRTCNTLKDWTYGISIAESLNELVCDVTHLKAREYKHICVAGNL